VAAPPPGTGIDGLGAAGPAGGAFPVGPVVLGISALFLLGLWDDRRPLRALWKGTLQGIILLGVLLLWMPDRFLSGLALLPLLWVTAMILLNAWNYIDHADGLFALNAGAAAAILALAIGWVEPGEGFALLLWSVAGTCAGFFLWNRPRARIFLGDAGSLPLGFILVIASLWIVDRAGTRALPAPLAAQAVVSADLLLVTVARLRRGTNIFVGGCEHSGHRMVAWVGGWATLVFFGTANLLLALLALRIGPAHPILAAAGLLASGVGLAFFFSRLTPPRSPA